MEERMVQVQELTVQELQLAVLMQVMQEKCDQLEEKLGMLSQQSAKLQSDKDTLTDQVKRGEAEMESLQQELLCAQAERDSAKTDYEGWQGDLSEERTRRANIENDIDEEKKNAADAEVQLKKQQETLSKTKTAKEDMDISAVQCQEASKELECWLRQNGNELNRMELLYAHMERIKRGEQIIGGFENAIGHIWDTVGKEEKKGEKRSMLLSD